MDKAQSAAYVNAMVACVNAEIIAMQAENIRRSIERLPPYYVEEDFLALIPKYEIGPNSVMALFREAQ